MEGESTALYLEKILHEQNPNLKLTRLARGLPLGVDLSYADQITLSAALENRTNLYWEKVILILKEEFKNLDTDNELKRK